jgi:hypothetical protein
VIFGALEFALVIIPAMFRSSKARMSPLPGFDIPIVLSRPVPSGNIGPMRSWYFARNDPHDYIRKLELDPLTPVNSGYTAHHSPIVTGIQHRVPGNDMNAMDKANKAILRANKAVLDANHAILEANTAIQEAGADDLEWIDEIAEMKEFRFSPKR